MPLRLQTGTAGFAAGFRTLLGAKREQAPDVRADVEAIIARVRAEGDGAVHELTRRFDRVDLTATGSRVPATEIETATDKVEPSVLQALEAAAARIFDYHRRQLPGDDFYDDDCGNRLGHRWRPIPAVGLYVPGGLAAYPSSLLMNALPARVAGVPRLVMVVPTPDGDCSPLLLAAARIAGIEEIHRIGGAQAVAALAYGTETILPVDKIVGPGNAWVSEAKRQVFGHVGIDMIAGPSEILVVADGLNDPDWIAWDLLSQAEHDTAAQSILITDDADFAECVEERIAAILAKLPRAEIAGESWARHGAIILVDDLQADAPALIDAIAPEHLELAVLDPEALLDAVTNAGAVFLGRFTPEAIGDYVAGPNHVLPTARSARFSSGLTVLEFVKRTSLVRCTEDGLAEIGLHAVRLAEAEGLHAHARSVAARLGPREAS